MEKIRTRTDEIHIDEHGIVHKRILDGVHIDMASWIESEKLCLGLQQNKKYLKLVDARAVHTMAPDVLAEMKRDLNNSRIATAIVSNRLGIRILIDYLTNIEKVETPVKIFYTQEQALEWLLSLKNRKQ